MNDLGAHPEKLVELIKVFSRQNAVSIQRSQQLSRSRSPVELAITSHLAHGRFQCRPGEDTSSSKVASLNHPLYISQHIVYFFIGGFSGSTCPPTKRVCLIQNDEIKTPSRLRVSDSCPNRNIWIGLQACPVLFYLYENPLLSP